MSDGKEKKYLRKTEKKIALAILFAFLFFFGSNFRAEASVGRFVNYQGKLTNTSDVAVSDGAYDMVFKVYDAAGGGSTLWTESWTDAALWTETGSTTITNGDGGDCPTTTKKIAYSTGTNESSLKAGQHLWNTTIKQSSIIDSVNTGSDFVCVFNPASTWSNGDDLTNRVYVRNGIFSVSLGTVTSLSENFTNANNFFGVTVGADSEMKPRKRMTAVPQAVNALNVVGDGYIGIGNTSASQDAVNVNYNPASGSNDAVDITYGSGGGTGTALKVTQSGTGDILNLFDGADEIFTALNGGNIGIGNTNPGALLDIGSAGTTLGVIRLEGSTSGYVNLQPNAVAGSATLTLPSTTGTLALTSQLHTQNTDTGTDGTAFTIGDGSTTFTIDTGATNDSFYIEQGTNDSTLTFTQPGSPQEYTFTTGGTVCTTGGVCSGYSASHSHSYLSDSTSSTQSGYFGDIYLYDDSTPSHYLQISNSGNLTAAHYLYLNTNDADRTISLSGDLTISNASKTLAGSGTSLTIDNSLDIAGTTAQITLGTSNHTLTLTTTNNTSVTLPTSGTLMTNPMTTAGDIIYGGASGTPTRLGEGTNNGYALKINTTTHEVYWAEDLQGSGSLPSGTNGQTLYNNAGTWTATSNFYHDGTNVGIGTTNVGAAKFAVIGGNVGIGTSSPQRRLEVLDSGGPQMRLSYNSTYTDFYTNSNGYLGISPSGNRVGIGTTAPLGMLHIGSTEPFVVDNFGRVGVGTTTVANGDLLQVGKATSRGDADVYGDITKKGYTIQRSLANIADIFIYDTTRDNDQGAWRTSTIAKQMSWYTETKDDGPGDACSISGDDRCGRSEFPEKAIIVSTANALYIFDAADNSLWMKFDQTGGTYALGTDTNNNPSGVSAVNGVVYVGTTGSAATGLYAFDFTQDRMYRYNQTNRVEADSNKKIGDRNTAITYATNANTNFALSTGATPIVYDVSAAVQWGSNSGMSGLYSAPTVHVTGPGNGMTLIAAATDNAVSVIHPAEQKVFSYSDVAGDDYSAVVMTRRGRFYALNYTQAQAEEWRGVDTDQASELAGTPDKLWDQASRPSLSKSAPTVSQYAPDALEVVERASFAAEPNATATSVAMDPGDIIYVGTNQGLAEIHDTGSTNYTAGWSKFYSTTSQTPFMPAGIRAAFLFNEAAGSTDATDSSIGTNILQGKGASAPTFGVEGVRGTATTLNNSDQYFCTDANNDNTCDYDADFNPAATSFLIAGWFKHSATLPTGTGPDVLVSRMYSGPGVATGGFAVWMNTLGFLRFAIDDDGTFNLAGESIDDITTGTATNIYSLADNQWHHVSAVNSDTGICLYVDGKLYGGCDTSLAATGTLNTSSTMTIGAQCNPAVADCGTGVWHWDGSLDEFTFSMATGTVLDALQPGGYRKLYQDGRVHLLKRAVSVTDATAGECGSTTIGDSGESWTPGEFVGQYVEITGGTGSGQTRKIVANTATTLTITPAWGTTPSTDSDFRTVDEILYGGTDTVTAIAAEEAESMGDQRKVYVGTSNGTDGGGITVLSNAGLGYSEDALHADGGVPADDNGAAWSGTDFDDIQALDARSGMTSMASLAHLRSSSNDISLQQFRDEYLVGFDKVRNELASHFLFGSTMEQMGMGLGADLAEYYVSENPLAPGDIVAAGGKAPDGVEKSASAYQKNILGVVATAPGMILGQPGENSYPVALVGRVPVNVTNENGLPETGDRIVSSALPGYGMRATSAGRVVGAALEPLKEENLHECPAELGAPESVRCGQITVFVNLDDYSGIPIEELMKEKQDSGLASNDPSAGAILDSIVEEKNAAFSSAFSDVFRQAQILEFLKTLDDPASHAALSLDAEIFTGRVSAGKEVISPLVVADTIVAKKIKAESIEGLEFLQVGLETAQSEISGGAAETRNIGEEVSAINQKLEALVAQLAAANQSSGDEVADEKTVSQEKDGKNSAVSLADLDKLTLSGGLAVGGPAEFQGQTVFRALAEFVEKTIFRGDVEFAKTAKFEKGLEVSGYMVLDRDSAGYAIIKKGEQGVAVTFAKEYGAAPVVNASLSLQQFDNPEVKTVAEDLLLVSDVKYIISNVTTKGFEIKMDRTADSDVPFSWQAVAVKDPKTFGEDSAGNSAPSSEPDQNNATGNPEISADNPAALPSDATPASDPVNTDSALPVSSAAENTGAEPPG